jgi:pyruvate kinase
VDLHQQRHIETRLVKSKIIATVGPACADKQMLRDLVKAGVDLFRLNFAHGAHEWLAVVVKHVREISAELERPVALLGDLSGPKIRLGKLPDEGIHLDMGQQCEFVREAVHGEPLKFTCTYPQLINDVSIGDRVLLADGTVALRVIDKSHDSVKCQVEQPGLLRSKQGVNLPGTVLTTPSLTDKDRNDLAWAIEHELDFVGLSFVRSADDIKLLRSVIDASGTRTPPQIIAKIEKREAIDDLERILDLTDGVMVARGDLGVEIDITRVPVLQKHIIRMCNEHRIPVITATQMLDSMQANELPTRAEASDVANAILDGSDAVMLSGETAIGKHPVKVVSMMSRIAQEAEVLVTSNKLVDHQSNLHTRALVVTEAVTLGASTAAEHLHADLIAVTTHSGRTAMAVSKQRSPVPILALTDRDDTYRRMCLYWGVTSVLTDKVDQSPDELLRFVIEWGRKVGVLNSGSRVVLVGSTDWHEPGHDLMVVHEVE